MKIGVLGGTGFVGSYLLETLLSDGHEVVALVRPGSAARLPQNERCRAIAGEISDAQELRHTLEGCEAAIYLIGILREFPARGITFQALQLDGARRAIDTAVELGVRRFLLMSANGVKPNGTAYQRTKFLAEQHLHQSTLEGTVFRPSVLFGDPRGRTEFATRLCRDIVRSPLPAPLFYEGLLPFGAGRFAMAPVHVRDVAQMFAQSLVRPETVGQTYALCGPEQLEWRRILQIIARAAGKPRKLALPAPAWLLRTAAALLERYEFFPLTREQLDMLLEGNTCADASAPATFGLELTRFDEQALAYLADQGLSQV